jgi:EAL domain-containing protein (putative c-di-GMP-specific phosphodiesterase class I)
MTACDQAKELQRIIDQQFISRMFQPIVDCQKGTVLGYEELSRILSKLTGILFAMLIETW